MATNWTEAQLGAIKAKKEKILVSAAAGSGKTATLIERIIRSITVENPPMDISRMLIVTFTRAAAAELRLRIMKALSDAVQNKLDDLYLRRQLLMLESADISTIDSFCLDVMRDQAQNSGSDYEFRIGDESELLLLKKKAMEESIEAVLRKTDADDRADGKIYEFFSVLGGARNDDELADNILEIYKKLINIPEGIEYIGEYIKELASDMEAGSISTRAMNVILDHTSRAFKHFTVIAQGYLKYFCDDPDVIKAYGGAIRDDITFFREVTDACSAGDYAGTRNLICTHKMAKLGGLKGDKKTTVSEKFVNDRSKYRDEITDLKENYFGCNDEDIKLINSKSIDLLKILYDILNKYEETISLTKKAKHVVEFDDLKFGVYKLFCNPDGSATELAYEYSSKYDIVYIDEYQDVDPIQGRIFNAISVNSCLYTVGDIKQSIYGFRGSDPTIFGDLRRSYDNYETTDKDDPKGSATIYMSDNFRCSEPIIRVSNHISSYLFKHSDECFGGVGYVDEDDLKFSKEPGKFPSAPVELVFVEPSSKQETDVGSHSDDSEDDDPPKFLNETLFIVGKINELIAKGKKEDGSSLTYSDFAILFDNNKQLKAVSDILTEYKIPCDDAPVENFFSSPEIYLLNSLLSVVDNPFRDVPLAAVLLSPIFNMTDGELTEIRATAKQTTLYESLRMYSENGFGPLRRKCSDIVSSLKLYSHKARVMPLDDFIPYLWKRLNLNAIASFASDDGKNTEMRYDNITKLYEYAVSYNSGIYRTLHDFLAYIQELIEINDASLTSNNETQSTDKVRLITIHKSKGLEFPVCFIFGTGFMNTGKPQIPEVLFESTVGLCFDPAIQNGLARINSPYRKAAMARRNEKQRLEKIRLLYVAMTRARERLFITCTKTKTTQKLLDSLGNMSPSYSPYIDTQSAYVILKARSYIEWILYADIWACKDHLKIVHVSQNAEIREKNEEKNHGNICNEDFSCVYDASEILKRVSFDYKPPIPEIPAKLAVSALSPSILDENPVYGEDRTDKRIGISDAPSFILSGTPSSAERGTANHLFLQFCDFEACENGKIESEIRRLTDSAFILPEHAEMINTDSMKRFFSSEFYKTAKNAKKVWREQRFNIPLPAHIFSEDSSKKRILREHYVLVQGVIDLIIELKDGTIILADYKTDYIPHEIRNDTKRVKDMFSERYSQQLSYYALAINRIFGKYPEKILIYSLSISKTVEMDFDPSQFD